MTESAKAPVTGLVWDESFMWHSTGVASGLVPYGGFVEPHVYVESPEPKRRIKNLMDRCGMTAKMLPVPSRLASIEELRLFHTQEYIEQLNEISKGPGGFAGPATPVGTDTFEIASRAVGSMIEAVDHIIDGKIRNAYAFLRPPGHHARAEHGFGMCVFGSAVIAARHALKNRRLSRVAIIDYDAHHGNGAQEAFYADPSVLTISIHQRGWSFLAGHIAEQGEGEGLGTNINVPLPSGCGDGAYIATFERVVIPALHRFKPDLIIVAAGYDIGSFDPMSRMMVSSDGFRKLTSLLNEAAKELCDGRIVVEQEGGYSPWATPFCAVAVMETLMEETLGIEDPFVQFWKGSPDHELLPHQDEVIREVEAAFGLSALSP